MNVKLGRVVQTKHKGAHIKNVFVEGKAARWEGEKERWTWGDITFVSKTGGHSYTLCFYVFMYGVSMSGILFTSQT